jgi:hypothetical protein
MARQFYKIHLLNHFYIYTNGSKIKTMDSV